MSTERSAPIGIRERQRNETAGAIERTTIEMFAGKGFDAVTGDDIAQAVGVSRRTFFRYFPGGKEEVVLGDLRRRMGELRDSLGTRPPQESALTALRESLLEMARSYELERENTARLDAIMMQTPSLYARAIGEQARLTDAIIQMVALRLAADPTTDPRPAVMVGSAICAAQVAFRIWLEGSSEPLTTLVNRALDVLADGLTAASTRT